MPFQIVLNSYGAVALANLALHTSNIALAQSNLAIAASNANGYLVATNAYAQANLAYNQANIANAALAFVANVPINYNVTSGSLDFHFIANTATIKLYANGALQVH